MRKIRGLVAAGAVASLALAACTTDDPEETSTENEASDTEDAADDAADDAEGAADTEDEDAGQEENEWFVQAEFEKQLAQRDIEPEGPAGQPWLQALEPDMVDTSEHALDSQDNKLCFSNASVSNPWRVTGWITMQQQVQVYQDEGIIGDFEVLDAADDDNQQISDIESFVQAGDCDAIIISPSTTATLTPAVQAACDSGVPVVVFDRGVNTDCMVTFIHPIGGYAYGADAADFLVDNLDAGSKVLALRILPGVDVLEHRWAAAEQIFGDSELEVVGVEFTEGDGAKIKNVVTEYLQRDDVHGIWMDAGAGSAAAVEAFEDTGNDYPVIAGEDELTFLRKWDETGLTGIAPSYPTYQWRTPVTAVVNIWNGEEVPSEWVLPQNPVTQDELSGILAENENMPDLHYARFGGEDLPGYPEAWEDRS